jgi:undecaprenyl diphosphate synthase
MISNTTKIPHHLGIIIDGNRRWAKEKGLPTFEGHRRGFERIKETIKWCKSRGVKILTFFCFSTENWSRPKIEVNYLMKLGQRMLSSKNLCPAGVRIKIIGEREKLPKLLQKSIEKIEHTTEKNKEMIVNLAISYGGRAEIVSTIKNIIDKKISPEKITEEVISENLWTSDLDLVIRTGKEQRLSNFLIWQTAYSELYFSPKYWPDFTEKDLDGAFIEYSRRKRRFGK